MDVFLIVPSLVGIFAPWKPDMLPPAVNRFPAHHYLGFPKVDFLSLMLDVPGFCYDLHTSHQ